MIIVIIIKNINDDNSTSTVSYSILFYLFLSSILYRLGHHGNTDVFDDNK